MSTDRDLCANATHLLQSHHVLCNEYHSPPIVQTRQVAFGARKKILSVEDEVQPLYDVVPADVQDYSAWAVSQ